MSAHRNLAIVYKQDHPEDPRTVGELEAYYRGLSNASPLARVFSAAIAKDRAEEKGNFAQIAANAAIAAIARAAE